MQENARKMLYVSITVMNLQNVSGTVMESGGCDGPCANRKSGAQELWQGAK